MHSLKHLEIEQGIISGQLLYMCMYMYVHCPCGGKVSVRSLPQLFSTFHTEAVPLICLLQSSLTWLLKLAGLLWEPRLHPLRAGSRGMSPLLAGIYRCSGGQNSGPQAYSARALPTEPSPQLRDYFSFERSHAQIMKIELVGCHGRPHSS